MTLNRDHACVIPAAAGQSRELTLGVTLVAHEV